jgi:Zn-dependent metalloprotease
MARLLALSLGAGLVAIAMAPPSTSQAASPTPKRSPRAAAQSLVQSGLPALQLTKSDDAQIDQVWSGPGGLKYVAYQRRHRGMPVVGGDFVIVTDSNGKVLSTSVAQKKPVQLASIVPTVSPKQATAKARAQVKTPQQAGPPLLVVWQGQKSHLAWAITVLGTNGKLPSRKDVYVDARSGEVLEAIERVAAGEGNTVYNGPSPVTIPTRKNGDGNFQLADPQSPSLRCQRFPDNYTFADAKGSFGIGRARDIETGCTDGYASLQIVKGMYRDWFNRNGLLGNGNWLPLRVGLPIVNAYYDYGQIMIGKNLKNQWISSLDVVSHEYAHALDDFTPGRISRDGTQEFVADVMGTAAEWYSNQPAPWDTPDFTIGEEVDLIGEGPIRYMYDPSILGDPNCYGKRINRVGVHSAAGVGNHWFYLLAMGSNPTNGQPESPTCNGAEVTGIGVEKAVKIFYSAMLQKTSASSYPSYRVWTLNAAKQLNPGSCVEFETVKAAWDAVRVRAQAGEPTCTVSANTITIEAPGNQLTNPGEPASLQILATDSDVAQVLTYSAAGLPNGLSIDSATGLISGNALKAGNFTVTISVTDTDGAGAQTTFGWTVPAATTCSGDLIVNGDFEQGNGLGWTASPGVINDLPDPAAHAGFWKAWIGGRDRTHLKDKLTQTIQIPPGCSAQMVLRVRAIAKFRSEGFAVQPVGVWANGELLARYSAEDKSKRYRVSHLDLSEYAGQEVTLQFALDRKAFFVGSPDFSYAFDNIKVNLS